MKELWVYKAASCSSNGGTTVSVGIFPNSQIWRGAVKIRGKYR